jgi:hypothetical protein
MKSDGNRLRLRWLPAISLVLCGLVLAMIMLPASSAIAAPGQVTRPRIYYDPPVPADGAPSPYVLAGAKWDKTALTYSFTNCPHTLDCAQAWQAVRDAAHDWDAVSGISLSEVSSNGDIRISWTLAGPGGGTGFDGPLGVLGEAFPPYQSVGDLGGWAAHLDLSDPSQDGGAARARALAGY